MTSNKYNHIKPTQKRLFYNMFYFKTKLSVKMPEKNIKEKQGLRAAVIRMLTGITSYVRRARGDGRWEKW